MKKWLVGLMAAGLCVASAWAATDTLNLAFTGVSGTSYTEWSEKVGDSGAVYAGQSAGGAATNPCIQLRSNNNNSGIVTTGSGGTATKVTVAWNDNTADARILDIYGKNEAYTAATDLYSKDNQGSKLGSLNKGDGDTELVIDGEYTFIGLRSNSGAIYLDSVAIEWGGETGPSVSLSASAKEVEIDDEVTITATAKNFSSEDVAWTWEGNGTADGATFTVDTSAKGEFLIKATATAGEETASASVTIKVNEPLVAHAITVSTDGNGTAEADAETAVAGTKVNLAVNPNDGFKLGTITVNGDAITGTSFDMPDEDAVVVVTFVEKPAVNGDELTRETTGVTGNSYTEWSVTGDSGTKYAGQSAGGNDSIQLRTTSPAGIVITESAGSDVASVTVEWNDATADKRSVEIYGSTTAYAGPGDLYGDGKGTLLGSIAKGDTTLEVSAGYPYIGILAKGGALYLTSVTIGFAGASGPSVSLSARAKEVEIGDPVTITATAKNFSSEDVVWTWEGNGTAEGATFTVDTSAKGEFLIKATATAGEETASASVTIKVNEPLVAHAITVSTDGNGTAEADAETAVAGTKVNLAINPNDGFKLGTITVNGDAITGTSFDMPDEDAVVVVTFVEKPAVNGDELTRETTGVEGSNYKEWTATGDSGTKYAGQSAGGNDSIQLRTTSPAGIVITESAGSDVASVTVEWNDATADKRSIEIYGSTTAYTGPDDLYGDGKGTLLGSIAKGDTTLEVPAGYPYIGILAKGGALYLTSVTIGFAGASGPSVSLSASAKEVEIGDPVTITATAKNFSSEDVAWTWEGNGTAEGATFTVDTSAKGEFLIKATATAGEETASASVTIKVNEPLVAHAITVSTDGNGTAEADAETAVAGTKVNLAINPNDGFKQGTITVNGDAITGTSFDMPDEDAVVVVTFVEWEAPAVYLSFEEGTYPTSYAATEAEVENHGTLAEEIPTVKFAVEQTYRGNDTNDKKVGDVALRLRAATSGDVATNAVFGNAKAFADAITSLSFQYARYGSDSAPTTLKVQVSEDGASWKELTDLASTITADLQTYSCDEVPANSVFFRILMTSSAKSFKRVNIDEIALEFGAPKPTISGPSSLEGKAGVQLTASFEVKNLGELTVTKWEADYGTITSAGAWSMTVSAADRFTMEVKATLSDSTVLTKEVSVTFEDSGTDPMLTCTEGTTINATVGKELVLHFTLTNAEFSEDDIISDGTEGYGVISDVTATTFVYTCTPTKAGTVNLTFQAVNSEWEDVFPPYPVTLNVTEGGGGGDAVMVKSFVVNADGTVSVTLSDGTTTSSGLQYSTDLKNWSTTPVNVKTAASAFVRVGSPE